MEWSPGSLQNEMQTRLTDFIGIDIGVCMTLLDVSKNYLAMGEAPAARRVLEKAQSGYDALLGFLSRVEDPRVQNELAEQLRALHMRMHALREQLNQRHAEPWHDAIGRDGHHSNNFHRDQHHSNWWRKPYSLQAESVILDLMLAYTVSRTLINGDVVPIVKFDDLQEAWNFIQVLKSHWPADYFVRGPQGETYRKDEAKQERWYRFLS
jgi:hypothetical protein